jgi:hypothetical protein
VHKQSVRGKINNNKKNIMDGQFNLESPMRRLVGPQEVGDEDELKKGK